MIYRNKKKAGKDDDDETSAPESTSLLGVDCSAILHIDENRNIQNLLGCVW